MLLLNKSKFFQYARDELTRAWKDDQTVRRLALVVTTVNFLAIAVGLAALAVHKIGDVPRAQVKWLYVTHDGSQVEWAGYIEMVLAAAALAMAAYHERQWLTGCLAALVAFLALDDVLMLHDTARIMIGNKIATDSLLLNREDLGELIYTGLVGLALLPCAWLVALHTTRAQLWRCLPVMAAIVLVLAFAVGLDLFHQILNNAIGIGHPISLLTGIAEDASELLAMGLVLISAVAQLRKAQAALNP